MDDRQAELTEIKNEVIELHTEWNRKYFHLKTVDNFIFHLDKIKNEADKAWIYTTLKNYLLCCKQIDEELDREQSNQLYTKFIDKIGQYYRHNLKFRMIGNKVVYVIIFLVLILIAGLVFNFLVSLIIIPPFVHFLIYVSNKQKQKKVYGIFY
jgi:hypothetical protein